MRSVLVNCQKRLKIDSNTIYIIHCCTHFMGFVRPFMSFNTFDSKKQAPKNTSHIHQSITIYIYRMIEHIIVQRQNSCCVQSVCKYTHSDTFCVYCYYVFGVQAIAGAYRAFAFSNIKIWLLAEIRILAAFISIYIYILRLSTNSYSSYS